MRKVVKGILTKAFTVVSIAICVLLLNGYIVNAAPGDVVASDNCLCYVPEDTETGYEVLVDDKASLLSEEEIEKLTDVMYYQGLNYGNMVFITCDDALGMSAKDYQWSFYSYYYGEDSNGVTFLIDMDNRKIWIQGYGALSKTITESIANVITDNVYEFASDGEYGECSINAFDQIVKVLDGKNIPKGLKYFGNACVAVIVAILFTFLWAYIVSSKHKASDEEILENINKAINVTNPQKVKGRVERIYDPPSDSSDSSGSSGGGGGGGGGHSF